MTVERYCFSSSDCVKLQLIYIFFHQTSRFEREQEIMFQMSPRYFHSFLCYISLLSSDLDKRSHRDTHKCMHSHRKCDMRIKLEEIQCHALSTEKKNVEVIYESNRIEQFSFLELDLKSFKNCV